MSSKAAYAVQSGTRRFLVHISSDLAGYSARISETFASDDQAPNGQPLVLKSPPRLEIDPGTFYRDRHHYRGELIKLVNAELAALQVHRISQDDDHQDTDAFIRANLKGWPEGYPEVTSDDLSDWN